MLNVTYAVKYKPFMLSVIMMNVTYAVTYKPFMVSVIMLNVVMLCVAAPSEHL